MCPSAIHCHDLQGHGCQNRFMVTRGIARLKNNICTRGPEAACQGWGGERDVENWFSKLGNFYTKYRCTDTSVFTNEKSTPSYNETAVRSTF